MGKSNKLFQCLKFNSGEKFNVTTVDSPTASGRRPGKRSELLDSGYPVNLLLLAVVNRCNHFCDSSEWESGFWRYPGSNGRLEKS